ncbi:hypothetical protein KKC88_01965 [Patescibacteria group bacterium]|nr:hypothetical protein [Patescibacteria group bacterium]MBU1673483.1 hypothetical protein [Patescibacteria group bacterium]MBU1964000.1 hypothetical protein [Patescibacteria group bacterium]
MEKSSQNMLLGVAIGVVVVLAGGFAVYFGSGCVDGDCLGFVRSAKIKAPATVDVAVDQPAQQVAEQPEEDVDFTKVFDYTDVEPMKYDNISVFKEANEPIAGGTGNVPLKEPGDWQEIDYHRYEFQSDQIVSEGTAIAGVQDNDIRATGIEDWSDINNIYNYVYVKSEVLPVQNNDNQDWNSVTASAVFNSYHVVGQPYVYLIVEKKGLIPTQNVEVARKSIPINNEGQSYYIQTDPFTMEAGEQYQMFTVVSVNNIPAHESESIYGWFSEVNYNTP